jgi:hypothetical protein
VDWWWQVIAVLLWTGLAVTIIAAIAGVRLGWRGRRNLALGLLLFAALGTSAFSLIGGFSVGRFTAVIPVLLTSYMLAMDRGRLMTMAALVSALAVYIACSWVLSVLLFQGGIFELILGAWAIPLYAVAAVIAYVWSVGHPVVRRHSRTSEA